ncbi:MAG TPA: YdeI/OmpD-associated family protein [Planctomycetota bacterium]|nr:YdeI/OmpD-associated family protein [Planctomycetota bacterium]
MGRRSTAVTAYIAAAEPFARPILRHLRKLFHAADPRLVETIKWGAPFFEHAGIVGSMSAFKRHVSIGFWRGDELRDPSRFFSKVGRTQMSMTKLTSLEDLPADAVLIDLVRQAVALNEASAAARMAAPKSASGRKAAPRPRVPADLKRAMSANAAARRSFESFSPSEQREYVAWLEAAKRPETRARRLTQAVEWLAEGKRRNWKYR